VEAQEQWRLVTLYRLNVDSNMVRSLIYSRCLHFILNILLDIVSLTVALPAPYLTVIVVYGVPIHFKV
jgi:hypothetical protein